MLKVRVSSPFSLSRLAADSPTNPACLPKPSHGLRSAASGSKSSVVARPGRHEAERPLRGDLEVASTDRLRTAQHGLACLQARKTQSEAGKVVSMPKRQR